MRFELERPDYKAWYFRHFKPSGPEFFNKPWSWR